jgi:hypothetical protein
VENEMEKQDTANAWKKKKRREIPSREVTRIQWAGYAWLFV